MEYTPIRRRTVSKEEIMKSTSPCSEMLGLNNSGNFDDDNFDDDNFVNDIVVNDIVVNDIVVDDIVVDDIVVDGTIVFDTIVDDTIVVNDTIVVDKSEERPNVLPSDDKPAIHSDVLPSEKVYKVVPLSKENAWCHDCDFSITLSAFSLYDLCVFNMSRKYRWLLTGLFATSVVTYMTYKFGFSNRVK
jgi:hypothetical protein